MINKINFFLSMFYFPEDWGIVFIMPYRLILDYNIHAPYCRKEFNIPSSIDNKNKIIIEKHFEKIIIE